MEKLVKVIVVGALGENGRVNANAQETIALYVDPFDKELRTFVLKAAIQRFAWLEFVPLDQLKLHWIDAEGDRISIYAEADMDICIEHGGSIPKIYIVVGPNEQLRSADTDAGCTATTSAQTDATKPSASGASAATPAASASAAAGALHPNVICDSCNGEVRGVRYKCAQCADFDLCSACESQGKHTHHMMYRMAEPQHDIGSHIERRLSKWLRKHMPRDAAEPGCQREAQAAGSHHAHHHHSAPPAATLGGGGCRRNGGSLAGRRHHHDWKRHCEPSVGTYTCTRGAGEAAAAATASSSASCSAAGAAGESKTAPQQQPRFHADHIADALSHARTAEKAAAAGFELLSKFSSILDPFGVNLADVVNAATGYNGGEANSASDGAERPGCQFAAAAKAAQAAAARAAEAATAAQTATAAAEAATATTSQAPQASSSAAAGETVVTTEPRPSTSAPSSVPATPQKSTANKEDNVSVRSADSMDSVLEALMEATKDANKGKPEPDVD